MSETAAQKPRVRRASSDATRFHMSPKAVDRSVEEYATWTEKKCVKHLAVIRWGSFEVMPCPHCGTCTKHYFYEQDLRWKCKHCGSKFSVTSQTVFSGRKLPYRKLLAAIHLWVCGAAGQPALELRRMLKLKSYNSAFTLVSKMREGLMRGFNTGLISGVVEMDGAHASGRRAGTKRGKPLNYQSPESVQTAFSKLGKRFQLHLQVNHSETLRGPNGEHNNLAESFSARQDRSEKGVYLNIEPKYLHDYAVETAFREDQARRRALAQLSRNRRKLCPSHLLGRQPNNPRCVQSYAPRPPSIAGDSARLAR